MANQRQRQLDAGALENWRKALPGIPDDQIVLPRYHAKFFCFPPAPHNADDPVRWKSLSDIILYFFIFSCSSTADDRGGDKSFHARTRRIAAKKLRQAMRWWRTLRRPTVLQVQHQLFARKNKWKDIQDYPEFLACLAITLSWLNLPVSSRAPAEIQSRIDPLLRSAFERYERERPDVVYKQVARCAN